MELAFLIVAAKPQRRLTGYQLRLVSTAKPLGFHFVPRSHFFWANDARTLGIGIWQECANTDGLSRWWVSPTRVVWLAGYLRWRGRPWPAEGEWAQHLAAATESTPLTEAAKDV